MKSIILLFTVLLAVFAPLKTAAEPALPRPAARATLQQASRAELSARHENPELFHVARQVPSNNPNPCGLTFSKRSEATDEQVLTAPEMAAFLMGRGSFTSSNGTRYVDEDYADALRRSANSHAPFYYRAYNLVKDSIGNKLLEISIPHYKKWKSSLKDGEVVYLSSMTAIRGQDVDELEQLLLANPDFIDIQVHGFRISKKFFEVATSY